MIRQLHSASKKQRCPSSRQRKPRGFAILIVLALIAITLGLSYALTRTQTTTDQIQYNHERRGDARRAAQAGISTALRRMSEQGWAGVDVPLTGQLDSHLTYDVTYATGDPSLEAGDPDYAEYPYRVTITSIGTAQDAHHAYVESTHEIQAVVQLSRRKLQDVPSVWNDMLQYTVYQWEDSPAEIHMPVRIDGPVHAQGRLDLRLEIPHEEGHFFDGTIDEVAIFDDRLQDDEIQKFYRSSLGTDNTYDHVADAYSSKNPINWWRLNETKETGTAIDSGRYGYSGAILGPDLWNSGPPFVGATSRAAVFNGANDLVHLYGMNIHDNGFSVNKMSMLAWVKIGHNPYYVDEEMRVITKASGDLHYWTLCLVESGSSWKLKMRLRSDGWTNSVTASGSELNAGQWYLIAATYSSHDIRLFVNDELVLTSSNEGYISRNSGIPAAIGGDPESLTARWRYLQDLQRMNAAGLGDFRPFDGPIDLPSSRTSALIRSRLSQILNVPTNPVIATTSTPLVHPVNVPSYQLYPGGEIYYAEVLEASLGNVQLAPNVETNPLGVFFRPDAVSLGNNVSITGTVITGGDTLGPDLTIDGSNIHLSAAAIPPLAGDDHDLQLPAAIVQDDFILTGNARASTLRGMVVTWDDFICLYGSDQCAFDVEGRLVVDELRCHTRSEWDHSWTWWESRMSEFLAQVNSVNGTKYFPLWLRDQHGMDPDPKLVIRPESSAVRYHWHDWTQPLFVPHPSDEGLVWELVRWNDNPRAADDQEIPVEQVEGVGP